MKSAQTGGSPAKRPSNAPSRGETKKETREALIRAGIAEFVEKGLDSPSLDGICARAGYTRGAFYVHFRDRDEFTVAVMESVLGQFIERILADDTGTADLESIIVRFAGAIQSGDPLEGRGGTMPVHRLIDACTRSPAIAQRLLAMLTGAQRRLSQAAEQACDSGAVAAPVRGDIVAGLLIALAAGFLQLNELGVRPPAVEYRDGLLALLRGKR